MMIEKVKYQYSVSNDKQVVRLVDRLLQEEQYANNYELLYYKALSLRNLWREDESIETLQSIIELYPEKEAPKVELANGYINLLHFDQAKDILENVLKVNRGNLSAINNLIYIHEQCKEWHEVIALCNQHLEYDESDPTVWLTLSTAFDNLKQFDKSIANAEKAVLLSQDDVILQSMAHNNLGYMYSKLKDFSKAEYHLRLAIELDDLEPYAHNNLGWVLAKNGKVKEGMKCINHSISLDDMNSYAYKNRAKIYLMLGDTKRAKRDLFFAKELGYTEIYNDEVEELLKGLN